MFNDFEEIMSMILFPQDLSLRQEISTQLMPLSEKSSKLVFDYLNAFIHHKDYLGYKRSLTLSQKTALRELFENRDARVSENGVLSYSELFKFSILAKKAEFLDVADPNTHQRIHPKQLLYLIARTEFNEPLKIQSFVAHLKARIAQEPLSEAFLHNLYKMAQFYGNQDFVKQVSEITGIHPSQSPVELSADFFQLALSFDDYEYYKTLLPMDQFTPEFKDYIIDYGSGAQMKDLIDAGGLHDTAAYPPYDMMAELLDNNQENHFVLLAEHYLQAELVSSDDIISFLDEAVETDLDYIAR
jgi:hypothetical protein